MTPQNTSTGSPRRKAGVFDHGVGALLREARLRAGLTQSDLGRLLGVTFQQVQKYESGANRVPASAYPVLFSELGLSPQKLFGAAELSDDKEAAPPIRSRAAVDLMRAFESLSPERRVLLVNLAKELSRP
ncbi:helix-turn-helix domain-containing protein [Brevundimonas aurifodinae]